MPSQLSVYKTTEDLIQCLYSVAFLLFGSANLLTDYCSSNPLGWDCFWKKSLFPIIWLFKFSGITSRERIFYDVIYSVHKYTQLYNYIKGKA